MVPDVQFFVYQNLTKNRVQYPQCQKRKMRPSNVCGCGELGRLPAMARIGLMLHIQTITLLSKRTYENENVSQ